MVAGCRGLSLEACFEVVCKGASVWMHREPIRIELVCVFLYTSASVIASVTAGACVGEGEKQKEKDRAIEKEEKRKKKKERMRERS